MLYSRTTPCVSRLRQALACRIVLRRDIQLFDLLAHGVKVPIFRIRDRDRVVIAIDLQRTADMPKAITERLRFLCDS